MPYAEDAMSVIITLLLLLAAITLQFAAEMPDAAMSHATALLMIIVAIYCCLITLIERQRRPLSCRRVRAADYDAATYA